MSFLGLCFPFSEAAHTVPRHTENNPHHFHVDERGVLKAALEAGASCFIVSLIGERGQNVFLSFTLHSTYFYMQTLKLMYNWYSI